MALKIMLNPKDNDIWEQILDCNGDPITDDNGDYVFVNVQGALCTSDILNYIKCKKN